jgi:acyl CoA:acetate/3-ketoacid CoA transferase
VVEIAPGVDLARDVQGQCPFPLNVNRRIKTMDAMLFDPALMGLKIKGAHHE